MEKEEEDKMENEEEDKMEKGDEDKMVKEEDKIELIKLSEIHNERGRDGEFINFILHSSSFTNLSPSSFSILISPTFSIFLPVFPV